jgi:hypothetical protein
MASEEGLYPSRTSPSVFHVIVREEMMDTWVGGHRREVWYGVVRSVDLFPTWRELQLRTKCVHKSSQLRHRAIIIFARPRNDGPHLPAPDDCPASRPNILSCILHSRTGQPTIISFIREIAGQTSDHDEVGKLSGSLPLRPQ